MRITRRGLIARSDHVPIKKRDIGLSLGGCCVLAVVVVSAVKQ